MQPSHPHRSVTPRERLDSALLYLCTDARRDKGDLAAFADAALAGGVDIIQLRDKGSPGEARFGPLEARGELGALAELKAAARRHGALLAVNDRADIAHAAGADVLHLGQDDLPPWYARKIVGPDVLLGRSTHDRDQAGLAAIDEHIDYFCTGPVWATPTKPGRAAAGIDLVRATAADRPSRPWFAIGGIDGDRLPEVLDAGATRVVVVRAITDASDPQAAARALKHRLLENVYGTK
ncbi:thiamine phosphate synthase [Nocardia terpenica]|uniref:Thiamine-phosphate synthase n=1 Tax=Nocardia terpenica TaxID=455432 RepID=A0A161XCY4_9NOCA|nr:thiamine phosphate synthase [Nocardia terpenica]KZM71138.1 thiamine phosphate synthase [Nocardia terpenica]NQE89535.1 thiamine phosphate synthase [Nocardia terpenica]